MGLSAGGGALGLSATRDTRRWLGAGILGGIVLSVFEMDTQGILDATLGALLRGWTLQEDSLAGLGTFGVLAGPLRASWALQGYLEEARSKVDYRYKKTA